MKLKKDLAEYFEEVFVTDAAVEHLFDKHLFVRVFKLNQLSTGTYGGKECVGMWVDCRVDRIEGVNTLNSAGD